MGIYFTAGSVAFEPGLVLPFQLPFRIVEQSGDLNIDPTVVFHRHIAV